MNEKLTLTINDRITMNTDGMPGNVLSRIKKRLSFSNPAHEEAGRRGYSTWNIPGTIYGYAINENWITLPRGAIRQVLGILKDGNVPYRINDQRRVLPAVSLTFLGELRPFQEEAARVMLSREFGTLQAPTGSGKTVIALYIIAQRKQPALVIVHSKELLNQWIERAETFLGIPGEDIGIIGDGKKTIGQGLTIGIINSIYPIASDIRKHFGHVIADEVHRVPSRTFSEGVSAFDSRYALGLSATPFRRDRLTRLIYWHIGDRLHEIEQAALEESGDVLRAEVITRKTGFTTRLDPSEQYSRMLSELTEDPERNEQIVEDVIKEANNGGGVCLVLSDRKAHCDELAGRLMDRGTPADVLTGDLSNRERQSIVERLNAGQVKILVATGQLIGEGFDCKSLSTLFLACPIKFSGRLIQYLGRVLRPAPGKKEARVYDYVDSRIGVLENAARARQRVYMKTS